MKKEEILEIVKNEEIKFIKLMFVDLRGTFKTVEIPSHELDKALDGKVMVDGSNIKGISVPVHKADTLLMPDVNSFRKLPFYDTEYGKVAALICDIYTPDGKPSVGCTRSNLKRELAKMQKRGFSDMNVGFEPEFFLLKEKPSCGVEKTDLVDSGAYCADGLRTKLMREMVFELERVGIVCSTTHHEASASQYEITYRFSDALAACDNILIVRKLIKSIAVKHGYRATFIPKLVSNLNGSGLHTNVSLVADGKNAFADKNGLSVVGKNFIGGVLTHARALSMLTNPTINSYKRLGIDGYEAPVNICWGTANRSTMVRIPMCSGNATRIEIRSTDSTANPYVAVAGILAAGLDGIEKKVIIAPTDKNIYALSKEEKKAMGLTCLPSNLGEAVTEFEKDDVIKSCLTSEMVTALVENAKCEIRDYNCLVNSFDFDRYF